MPATTTDAGDSIWSLDPTRDVTPGTYYRFGVVVPNTWTQDATYTFLGTRGWDVKAFELPRPDVAQALKDFSSIGFQAPNAWYVHATWHGAEGTLPANDGQLFYGPMEYSAAGPPSPPTPVPQTSPPGSTTTPDTAPPADSGMSTVIAVGVGIGLLAVASYFMIRPHR